MYAIVVTVDLDTSRSEEATAVLNNVVIPQAKASPGFSGGYWMRSADHAQGVALELFDSQESAAAALTARATPPPGGPVTVTSMHVMEVSGTA
jgi:hypothetical protein